MIPDIAPEYTVFAGTFRDSPEWGIASILNPFFAYRFYGDTNTLNATYQTGKAYLLYLASKIDPASGLITYGLGDWLDTCGDGPGVCTPAGVTATAVFIQGVDAWTEAATVLQQTSDIAIYANLSFVLRSAYDKNFLNTNTNSYPSQTANSMAVINNINTSPIVVTGALNWLISNITGEGNVTTSGDIGNRYTWLALGKAASASTNELVSSILTRTNCPGYGCMLVAGETALAENWYDASTDSHIHAMLGHIDEYFYTYIAGIQMNEAAEANAAIPWSEIHIKPQMVHGLTWVNASFDSPLGMIRSAWTKLDETSTAFEVELPPGASGKLTVETTGEVIPLRSGKMTHRV
jgi:hypothetical protein